MHRISSRMSVPELCRAGIFTAVTALLSQISVPLPFTPIPLSLGLAAVFLTGLLLAPRTAFLCQLCYLLLGAVGLPVYHSFQGGIGVLFGPTGGFLFAYPLAALGIALMVSMTERRSLRRSAAYAWITGAELAATAVLYLIGTLWLQLLTGNSFLQALTAAVLPFIPLDMAKLVVCTSFALPLRRHLRRTGLLQ